MKYKHRVLIELWRNRPWVYIPEVIRFVKKYPYKKEEGSKLRIYIRNVIYLNWQCCLKR